MNSLSPMFLFFLITLHLGAQATPLNTEGVRTQRLKRSSMAIACSELFLECKKNASCNSSFRTVKKKCTAVENKCQATPSFLTQCAIEIEYLKKTVFKQVCSCSSKNSGEEISIKKLQRCIQKKNMIFANPCHDHGLSALEEQRLLQATSTKALVPEEKAEPTVTYNSTVDSDQSMRNEDGVTFPTGKQDQQNKVTKQNNDEIVNVVTESQTQNYFHLTPVDEKLSEKEYEFLDDLISIGHERPADAMLPFPETNDIPENSVKDRVNDDVETTDATTDQDHKADNENKLPSDPNLFVISTYDHSFHDVNSATPKNKLSEVTDGNLKTLVVSPKAFDIVQGKTDQNENKDTKNDDLLEKKSTLAYEAGSHHNEQNDSEETKALQITFIVAGSITLLIATSIAFIFYKRFKAKNYISGKFFKKSCQSSVIIESIYADNNLEAKMQIEQV